jgi:competence protein ComQ
MPTSNLTKSGNARSEAIQHLLDAHFKPSEFHRMARRYIDYKQQETSVWPELTRLSYLMFGGKSSPELDQAAARTELIILSLDMLDDLQDQDNFEPPWMQDNTALVMNCASNLLLAGLSGLDGKPAHAKIFSLLVTAHNGQHQDLSDGASDEEHYLEIVSGKSAALINLAIQMGYQILERRDPAVDEQLDELANCIGIAAQLQNDLKGLTTLKSRNDLVNRKKTLATMFLLDLCVTDFPLLKQYYDGESGLDELIRQKPLLVAFIEQSGVTAYISAVQQLYLNRAKEIMEALNLAQPWAEQFKAITVA